MTEKVLIVGGGAREHALAHKLANNSRKIFVTPGNAGINFEFECINLPNNNIDDVVNLAQRILPDLVIIGPEKYLAEGIVDNLRKLDIPVFGPSKKAAQIESQKSFMKKICEYCGVKTAQYKYFSLCEEAKKYITKIQEQVLVIKADGLCGGKGVTIAATKDEALAHVDFLYNHGGFEKLGCSTKDIIIEEFLSGRELSIFGLVGGDEVVLCAPMQDYKRQKENNLGPNTGGMGAFGPVLVADGFLEQIKHEIFLPVIKHMKEIGCAYQGLLYAGLMITSKGNYVLEFNCRFGDPETQALLFGLQPDIYDLLYKIAAGKKFDSLLWQQKLLKIMPSINIVMASKNYPVGPDNSVLINLDNFANHENRRLYFAATRVGNDQKLWAKSGRVLNIVARAPRLELARNLVYQGVAQIKFSGQQYRGDIGLAPDSE